MSSNGNKHLPLVAGKSQVEPENEIKILQDQIEQYTNAYQHNEQSTMELEKYYQNRIKKRQEIHRKQLDELDEKFSFELQSLAKNQHEEARKILEQEEQKTTEMLKLEQKRVSEIYEDEFQKLMERVNVLEKLIREKNAIVSDFQLRIQQKETAIKLKERLIKEKNNQRKKYLQQEINIYRQQLIDIHSEWNKELDKSRKTLRTIQSLIAVIENKHNEIIYLIRQYKKEIEKLDKLIQLQKNNVISGNVC